MTTVSENLEQCAFFGGISPKFLEKIALLAERLQFRKDEVIFREDDTASSFYLILSGRVALEARAGTGMLVIDTLYSGDVLGWSAVLSKPKQFQARAVEAVEVLSFQADRLREALDTNPYFARAFLERLLATVSERLQNTRLQLAIAARAASRAPVLNAKT